jgi:CO/xanthine dehydrogenase Mo-binding subunit
VEIEQLPVKPRSRPAELPEPRRASVGTRTLRREDDRLLRGAGAFADDLKAHRMGYVHFVRSPYAHARVTAVDVRAAEALDGVYGTLTPNEVALLTTPFTKTAPPPGGLERDYCLAVGTARHVGQPVAAVVAETRELAQDSAELVEVDYEPLPALVDARTALDGHAPVLHPEVGSNVVWHGVYDWGDIDAALAAADHVVEIDELHFERFTSTPLECAAAVVEYDEATEEFTLFCHQQVPPRSATWMAPALGTTADRFRFVVRDVGGAFGNKTMLHPYLLACCLLAKKLGRPVKWTETRSDQHTANAHGNERWFHDTKVAVMNDGRILGCSTRATDDCGAYARYEPLGAAIWSQVASACYAWQNIRVDFTQVFTNKSPVGANRGYSRMQHIWLIERIVDIVAGELGLDPVEIRKRNYVKREQMPYTTLNGCVYDSGDYEHCLDLALAAIDYDGVRARQREQSANSPIVLGVGIGSTLDSGTNNTAQTRLIDPQAISSGNSEAAVAKLDLLGEIVLTLGTTPQGQGHETTAAQVAADILAVSPDAIRVRSGHDTFWNAHTNHSGTTASQFAVTGLGAVQGATRALADEIRRFAAWTLKAQISDIELGDGIARVVDAPERSLSYAECARRVFSNLNDLPPELTDVTLNCRYVYRTPFPPYEAERQFGNLALTYASQIHACVVEIDTETGVVQIIDYAAVDDCGLRVNPMIVEGQVQGAIAHSIGAALFETLRYDNDGNLLTPNFYDYHVPHAMDMPPLHMRAIESVSPTAPLGAKGMGEGGGGALHSICAAIQDALRHAGSRAIVTKSFNPPERVLQLLNER